MFFFLDQVNDILISNILFKQKKIIKISFSFSFIQFPSIVSFEATSNEHDSC